MSKTGDFGLRKDARLGGIGAPTKQQSAAYQAPSAQSEHGDMGNLTPRILRCINALNVAMGAVGENASRRRVHHNAESHRNRAFGALTREDMTTIKEGESYGCTAARRLEVGSSPAPAMATSARWRTSRTSRPMRTA
jgi:hypothetical protein